MLRNLRKKAQSSLEFITLFVFLMVTFFVFQKYITRAFVGRWKGVGDAMGQGRIYDPGATQECAHGDRFGVSAWYDVDCFDSTCGDRDCLRATANAIACDACIASCFSDKCEL